MWLHCHMETWHSKTQGVASPWATPMAQFCFSNIPSLVGAKWCKMVQNHQPLFYTGWSLFHRWFANDEPSLFTNGWPLWTNDSWLEINLMNQWLSIGLSLVASETFVVVNSCTRPAIEAHIIAATKSAPLRRHGNRLRLWSSTESASSNWLIGSPDSLIMVKAMVDNASLMMVEQFSQFKTISVGHLLARDYRCVPLFLHPNTKRIVNIGALN